MPQSEHLIDITFYTDPLCCWSWAIEPHWKKLLAEYQGLIAYSYRMGGLIKDWNTFNDPMNAISKPVQMGPVWMEAKYISGAPIQDSLWIQDAPSSSYPACIAVKSAAQQSKVAEEKLLYALWEAAMAHGQNIAHVGVIMKVAQTLGNDHPEQFSWNAFKQDFNSEPSRQAFREDLESTKNLRITRFPTLILQNRRGEKVQVTGYRPYDALKNALVAVCPEIERARTIPV